MFGNYLKIILRNLKRQKVHSSINILGLAVGITCFIALSLFILDEMGYDEFNEKADQIYRVCVHSNINGQESHSSKTPGPLGRTLQKDFPEVISYTRIGYFGQFNFRYEDKYIRENGVYTADSTFFSVFTLPLIHGNPGTVLKQPNSLVLTETSAKKYFGNEYPIGKTIIANDNTTFLVTGVMKDFPRKSHFSCGILLSMSTYDVTERETWLDGWYSTYILFREGTDPNQFDNKLQRVIQKYVGPQAEVALGISLKDFFAKGNTYEYFIQPLKSIYLYSQSEYGIDTNTEWGDVRLSNINYSYIFVAIAVFILLIAVFNFMNLATAKAERRVKEVGIRKTLGSDKFQLIRQFITESIFT
jgi:putative ABC transport system permease protein